MGTTTLLSLDEKLLQTCGDWKQELVTTELAATTTLVSTHLPKYRSSVDYFNNWWVYVEDYANAGVEYQVADDDGTNTLSMRVAWSADAASTTATFRLSRSNWDTRKRAINDANREIYPTLFRAVELRTLVTGNILPNSHFEDWAVTTTPDFYTACAGTTEANTTVTYLRGGVKSMKVTAGAASDYVYIDSNDYPRLLDLMDCTVSAKVWVYPEVANNATITIYTEDKAGSTQTLASTTACAAGRYTLLELEDQELNDDLTKVQIRFGVTTDTKYAYFDAARVTGLGRYEYVLPDDFIDGTVSQVYVQSGGFADDPCDDLHPTSWDRVYDYDIIDDGSYKYIRLPNLYASPYQIRLIGTHPLEILDAATDTISLDGEKINLLIAYAKYKLYQAQEDIPASEDISRYERASAKAYAEYLRLAPRLQMVRPHNTLKLRI